MAFVGLAANVASAWVLMQGGGHEDNLNTRGAFLHVVGDTLGSAGPIAAALIRLATGWYLADPFLSAGIGILILWSSWRLLRESVDVLPKSTPKGVDPALGREAMAAVVGVAGAHIWTVTSGLVSVRNPAATPAGRRSPPPFPGPVTPTGIDCDISENTRRPRQC